MRASRVPAQAGEFPGAVGVREPPERPTEGGTFPGRAGSGCGAPPQECQGGFGPEALDGVRSDRKEPLRHLPVRKY